MSWQSLGTVAVVTALSVGVAACGSSQSASSTSTTSASSGSATATASSGSTATGSTVKVGMINPTGAEVSSPDINGAVKAGLRAINARGGLAGHKVELDLCNDRAQATLAQKCAQQMVQDKVVAMISQIGLEDQISQPILEAAGIPEILSRATAESVLNSKNVFLVVGGSSLSYPVAAAYFAKKLHQPYNFMITDTPGSTGLQKSLLARLKAAGASPVSVQRVNPNQADYGPIVAAAQKGGAQDVLGILAPQAMQAFVKAAGAAGNQFQFMSTNAVSGAADASSFGGTAQLDKVISVVALPPLNTSGPGVTQFVNELKAEQATGDNDAALSAQTGNGFTGWLCVYALEQVVKQQKTTDISPAGLKQAFVNAKDVDLAGLTPPWTPNKPGPAGLGRLSNDSYYVVGYKQGQPFLLTPHAVTVENALAGTF